MRRHVQDAHQDILWTRKRSRQDSERKTGSTVEAECGDLAEVQDDLPSVWALKSSCADPLGSVRLTRAQGEQSEQSDAMETEMSVQTEDKEGRSTGEF